MQEHFSGYWNGAQCYKCDRFGATFVGNSEVVETADTAVYSLGVTLFEHIDSYAHNTAPTQCPKCHTASHMSFHLDVPGCHSWGLPGHHLLWSCQRAWEVGLSLALAVCLRATDGLLPACALANLSLADTIRRAAFVGVVVGFQIFRIKMGSHWDSGYLILSPLYKYAVAYSLQLQVRDW